WRTECRIESPPQILGWARSCRHGWHVSTRGATTRARLGVGTVAEWCAWRATRSASTLRATSARCVATTYVRVQSGRATARGLPSVPALEPRAGRDRRRGSQRDTLAGRTVGCGRYTDRGSSE